MTTANHSSTNNLVYPPAMHGHYMEILDDALQQGVIDLELWKGLKVLIDSIIHIETSTLCDVYLETTSPAVKTLIGDIAKILYIDEILDLLAEEGHEVEIESEMSYDVSGSDDEVTIDE